MMLHLLSHDGDEIDSTMDIPPEQWASDFDIAGMRAHGITAESPDRMAFQAEILMSVLNVVHTDDDAPIETKQHIVFDLLQKSMYYWVTGVLDEFDEKSPTQDGFVKIFDDHVEWGWMERRDPRKLN